MKEHPVCTRKVRGLNPRSSTNFTASAAADAVTCGLAPITVGNGGKGTRPMAFRRAFGFGQPRQARPSCPRWETGGDSGQAMRGSSAAHAPALPGMQARERPRGGATRDTDIVNREGQRVVHGSASLTSKCACAECWGSGEQPASWFSVKYPVGERQAACCISWPKRRGSDRGAHVGMGSMLFSSVGRAIASKAVGRRFNSGSSDYVNELNGKTRPGTGRKWLKAEAFGQFGGPDVASGGTLAEHRTVG